MKSIKPWKVGMLFALFFLFAGKAIFAETVEGKVYAVNKQQQTLQISPRVGEPKINLRMDSNASLQGIQSFDELEVGDRVRADIRENDAGEKTVRRLELNPAESSVKATPLPGAQKEKYSWGDKLSRGVVNFFTSPVELPRTIDKAQEVEGATPGEAWTVGLLRGVGRTFLRAGAGLVDVVTFPFDFPHKGKTPLILPEFAWQKWPVYEK